jgi:hypothetical protein
MARVLLLTTADETKPETRPFAGRDFPRFEAAAAVDRFHVHSRTDDPTEADVILFVGVARTDFSDVRKHPYVRRFREKCFVFESGDRVLPFLPGVYACAETRWFSAQRTAGGFYLRVFENDSIVHDPVIPDDAWLFSFVGRASNAPVRRALATLMDPRGKIVDTSREAVQQTDDAAGGNAERWNRYVSILQKSCFVLCPRGIGTSSWRLFESMKAGRAPVILSDDWRRPLGPCWEDFSITVAERDAKAIPSILRRHEARAAEMGLRARQEWESWFSREVAFHRVVDWCLGIVRARRASERVLRLTALPQLLRPFHFRHIVLAGIRRRIVG